MAPRQITHKEAQQIARHHLGERLQRLLCFVNAWQIDMTDPDGAFKSEMFATEADFIEGCCRWASIFRAAGWVPTHPRLEWQSRKWQHHLCFLMDNFRVELFFVYNSANGWTVWGRHDADNEVIACRVTAPVAAAPVAEWCAANLPSLYLPPFPETPDA